MRRAIARGRVFPQSYSTDRRYGRLSLKACALFPLMWANADDQGRLSGNPEEVKYAVCPNIDHITKADIPELLEELDKNELIKVYNTAKTEAIQMLDWWQVQRLQWAWPSEYAPPEGWQDCLRYKKSATEMVCENWPPFQATPEKPIYFIINDEAKAVKFGVAASPEARLNDLQAATPHKLRIAKVIHQGGSPLEQKLHQMFADYALGNEWFRFTKEIQAYLSGEDSGEGSGESSGEIDEIPLTTLENKEEKERGKRRGRGRGNSPEFSGEDPSPSPIADTQIILRFLIKNFRHEWGRVPAEAPSTVIEREPNARELAQLRDLGKELSARGGVPLDYIKQAFGEAAGAKKFHISYVRAILLDWLGLARSPP